MNTHKIPISGRLCQGIEINLGWPDSHEAADMAELRNKQENRKWFVDQRSIPLEKSMKWILDKSRRPYDAILSIRLNQPEIFIGTIGWKYSGDEKRELEIGRLILDKKKIQSCKRTFQQDYLGLANDIVLSIREFSMNKLGINTIITKTLEINERSLKLSHYSGLTLSHIEEVELGGQSQNLVVMSLHRDKWKKLKKHPTQYFIN